MQKNFFKYKIQKIFWREYAKMILKMKIKLQKRVSFDESKVKNEFAKNFFKYKSQKPFWREYATIQVPDTSNNRLRQVFVIVYQCWDALILG